MKLSFKIYTLLILFGASTMVAQKKSVQKGDKEFNDLAYISATEDYLKAAENGDFSEATLRKLGDSYYFTADYENAAKWYGKLFDFAESTNPDYLHRYAQSLKSTKQYAASDAIMDKLNAAKPSDERVSLFVNERNYLKEIENNSGRFELENLPFNSELSDFAPTLVADQLVFASNRIKRSASKRIHEWNEQPFLDLYTVPANSSAETAKKFSSEINTKYHESTAIFTKDGETIYFTRNNFTESDYKADIKGVNRLKLYRAKKVKDSWRVWELPFNSDQYSVAHPALSPDEKTLYFASDMPGSVGMSDLYKVALVNEGFGIPERLGDNINTEGRETFPFMDAKGNLYFASDGHVGLGGLDVFVTTVKTDGTFGDVYNLGRPVNSPEDDFTFVIDDTTKTGYFASNREGGQGEDDIYGFIQLKPLVTICQQTLSGVVKDQKTNLAIAGATVELIDKSGEQVSEVITDAEGAFSFGKVLCETDYTIQSKKDDYSPATKSLTTTQETNLANNETLMMAPIVKVIVTEDNVGEDLFVLLDLDPINFDLNKSDIRPDAARELQKVIAYLNQYPTVKIDIRSHTDSRGSDAYNEKLSDRRAKSTMSYIIDVGGVSAFRLNGRGYGETQLKNQCSNGVKCSKAEHEQNRRSEFIIVAK